NGNRGREGEDLEMNDFYPLQVAIVRCKVHKSMVAVLIGNDSSTVVRLAGDGTTDGGACGGVVQAGDKAKAELLYVGK
ncbi:hypothetical protein A2U01_0097083, partial [Trifolium medium]|nr:hypothetical protein [Trifolium medium]